jgi:aryl-alcohol dehydrogenase-like predicted oxidoreductase
MLRGEDLFFTYVGSSGFELATDSSHAANLVEADIIQTLSAIGREMLDVYFLRIRKPVSEFRVSGALEALESARQQGHLRFIGMCCDQDPFPALATWQLHDAFELVMAPRSPVDHRAFDTLQSLARQRRVGMVASNGLDWVGEAGPDNSTLEHLRRACADHPVVVTVKSAREAQAALSAIPGHVPIKTGGTEPR